ncbi:MAG: ClpP family protease [Cytophagales bacterium]
MSDRNEFKKYATKHLNIAAKAVENHVHQIPNTLPSNFTPNIVEQGSRPYYPTSVFDRLMRDRIIFLCEEVNPRNSSVISAQMLYFESEDPKKPIKFYLNTPGGSIHDGLAIYDTMQLVSCPIHPTAIGMAASMGSILLVGGESGKRTALPHSRVMIHQPMGGTQNRIKMNDMEILAKQMMRLGEELYRIISTHSGQPFEKVHQDARSDFWMTAKEAQAYGIIDHVLSKTK